MHLVILMLLCVAELTEGLQCGLLVCPDLSRCVKDNGTTKCSCDRNCTLKRDLLCGENGITYINQCNLEEAGCKLGRTIAVKHKGNCTIKPTPPPHACAAVRCSGFKTCVVVNGSAVCMCPACSRAPGPVCGSNNKTYINDCHLRLVSCRHGTSIHKIRNGTCDDCKKCHRQKKFCEYSLTNGTFYCSRCPESCPSKNNPVCGSDDRTYSTLCSMKKVACIEGMTLKTKYNGTCDEYHKSQVLQLAVGISLGVIAICALVVFAALWFSFRFRIPKKTKRWDKLFSNEMQ